MSSAAASAQTAFVSNLEEAEAMAAPAAKKARVEEPKSFKELDVEAMTLKVVDVKDDKYYVPLLDNEVIRFVLTPDEPTKVIWGFDIAGAVEQRSFNTPGIKAKSIESLSIRVELGSEQAEFLEKMDAKFKAVFGQDSQWTPLLSRNDKYEKLTAKLNVCLSGEDSALTLIKVKPDDVVERGYGWVFLKSLADADKGHHNLFTGAEVKAVAKLRAWRRTDEHGKIWAGLKLAASQLFFKPKPRMIVQEADILEDW